jgi:hypothetical protein
MGDFGVMCASPTVEPLAGGQYLVRSPGWNQGAAEDVGAIIWSSGVQGPVGTPAPPSAVVGKTGGVCWQFVHDFSATAQLLVVGWPTDNRVVVVRRQTLALTVATEGDGQGVVTSVPAGINCGGACTAEFTRGAEVMLTASATGASAFAGWTGACSGAGECIVRMQQTQGVTATFEAGPLLDVNIPVDVEGGTVEVEVITPTVDSGAGFAMQVTSESAAGEVQSAAFAATYPFGTGLRLTATPDALYSFKEWSGSITGSQNPVEVTVTSPMTITAEFVQFKLLLPTVRRTAR